MFGLNVARTMFSNELKPMTNERIEELISKFMAGDISVREKTELEEWLSSEERPHLFQFVEREEWVRKGIAALDRVDVDAGYEKFLHKYHQPEEETTEEAEPETPVRRIAWTKIAGAAAAVLVLALGSWFFFFRSAPPQDAIVEDDIRTRYKNDVSPGGNVATLELADGSTIQLDKSAHGLLADEGDATIEKTAADRLEYNSSKTAKNGKAGFNTITTPSGGQYHVVLPDGSRVWLNAASSLRFPLSFTGSERRVTVTGEAFFEVEEMKKQGQKVPFIVSINKQSGPSGEVQVLGTRFNINAYNDEPSIQTTLLRGSVRVVPANRQQMAKVIKPGQQADFKANGPMAVSAVDSNSVVAWRDGKFSYKKESIHVIMRQLARWYNVKVIFKDDLDAVFASSFPRSTPISEILESLEQTGIIRFTIEGKTVTVMR
ncbi:DUF4974 domain-containing protein [Pseudoflavitalea sp. G-6-1-2]|uniref:FecR family protein n=1 Tax=Pseudoflavitalea sp. G-6-1-2 TaxID=2728841 RepID=UPI00146AED90|nr:FecR family protein [Pseudoflavitalea sp. G-6-1-2]NML19371.1 DUF4974 domain-containing protein [Pseudoflavitalea sp. G-6-1-2]